jgi:hypothetical protein
MYTFVHVTKSGGTAVEMYFQEHLSKYITGVGHENVCTRDNNPIIIIREPVDRFMSMYKYWKRGSDMFTPAECTRGTIKDFIQYMKHQLHDKLYNQDYLWYQHFAPTCDWIKTSLSDIIAIKYSPDLGALIPRKLCQAMNIPGVEAQLKKVNISVPCPNHEDLDKYDLEFIHEYYKNDFNLWNTLCYRPHEFKMVIE